MPDEERLSADDAHILALESGAVLGHTLKLMLLEPGEAIDLDALRRRVEARLDSRPRSRERVDTDGGVPRWVPVDVDITAHVRRRAGIECATEDDLRRTVGELMSERLDRTRPLWTLDVIGPLADGREAVAARLHHAMVDGIAGVRLLEGIVIDPHDAPPHPVGTAAAEQHDPRGEWLRMPAAVGRELRPGGPSPFDLPITSARELAFVAFPLAELKAIGASRPDHATVNDVLLAAVAGGLHAWLGAREGGRDDDRTLRAQIPVSLHHRDEDPSHLGNRDSFLDVDLDLRDHDPLHRLDRISAETRVGKQSGDAALLYDLFHALGRLGPVGALAQRAASSSREFSVAISNVPGPRVPVSVAGKRVTRLYTSSEPGAHHALRVSAISNTDHLGVGFCTDPTALPDVAELAAATDAAYGALRTAALTP